MEPIRGRAVHLEQPVAHGAPTVVLGSAFFLHDGDTRFLREALHRGGEVDALVFHDEFENAAARSAAEAVVGLLLRADVE